MRKKTSAGYTNVHMLFVGAAFFAASTFFMWRVFTFSGLMSEHVAVAASVTPVKNVGVPVRIKIPSIGLDAAVERVNLTAKGAMDVPKNHLNTGWYELGPRPGQTGSAVIDGHVDWLKGATAVFANLHKIKVGETITVQDEAGVDITFRVREIRKFSATANATDVFSSRDGKAHLNLVTCNGIWDKIAKRYTERLVIFTDRVVE